MRAIARSPEQERSRYQWLSTGEAAKRIGGKKPVSTAHVLRLIKAGLLRARNVGIPGKRPEWRVDPVSLDKFLDDNTTVAA